MSSAADDKDNNPASTPMDSNNDSDSKSGSCQSIPREKKPNRAISLFKEDFGNFKQDILNIFKDKDVKTAKKEEKRTLDVLKEDMHQFREEFSHFRDDISGMIKKGLGKGDTFKIKAQEQNGKNCDEIVAESWEVVEGNLNEEFFCGKVKGAQ